MKEKIIAGCIIIAALMTIFPPQQITTIQNLITDPGKSRIIDSEIEYKFIGAGGDYRSSGIYDQASIAVDRLILQYLVLIGVGFAIYIVVGKKNSNN